VLKALEKDPNYRYQSADEMREDIEACLDGRPVAATAAMGSVGYGAYGSQDQATTALRTTEAGATSMLPPMNPDDGGYGYDERPDRRRQKQQKKASTSTILLIVAGVLVLVGAILIGKYAFSGNGGADDSSVKAPNFVGQTQAKARAMADNVGLKLSVTKKPCEDQAKGNVCSQDPEAATDVKKDDTINLVVSTGAPKVTVPSVISENVDDAKSKLEGDDYKFTVKTQEKESTEDPGTVLDQTPVYGKEVEKGSTITLTIAKEVAKSTVPDVSNQSCDAAVAQMTDNNLQGTCTEVETDDTSKVGKVIQTSPASGTSVDKNSKVTIQIGKAAQKSTVPNVVTQTVKDAKATLAAAGYNNIKFADGSSQDDNARVAVQDPAANSQVDSPDNTTVTLTTVGGNGNNNGGNDGGLFGGDDG
jgi:serine/threonine-protein kinase